MHTHWVPERYTQAQVEMDGLLRPIRFRSISTSTNA